MNRRLIHTLSLTVLLLAVAACQMPPSPSDLSSAPVQPELLQDGLLQEAWQILDNHQVSIQLWDGKTLSGHDLAQFAQDNAIPVVWDTENACGGASCSVNDCTADVCTNDAGKSGANPIYLSLLFQTLQENQMERLVASMAHEIYHRMEPFGKVRGSQYEEYTAIYLAAKISGSTWQNFEGYDPKNPVCLVRWFNQHRLFDYLDLPAYPQSVAATLDASASSDCVLEGDLVCTVTLEGGTNCQPVQREDIAGEQ